MKSKEVLRLLKVSRVTLMTYVKTGKITATKLSNGCYDYHDHSVYKFLQKDIRYNVIYARVSTNKQKNDLDTQVKQIVDFCTKNKISVKHIFKDISSGIDLDRKYFSVLLDDVFNYKIKNIYISYKDRLTRLSFKTIEQIFKKFGTSIVIINQNNSASNQDELFEELLNFIHYFTTKTYSKRRTVNITDN